MRLTSAKILLTTVLGVAVIAALPLLPRPAQARGFGGFHGGGGYGGGFGGGSFHEGSFGGGSWSGAHGGQAAWGPRGGGVAQGPGGATVARGPYGGGAAEGPRGGGGGTYDRNVTVNRNYNVSPGAHWEYYGGGAAAAGAVAGAAAGLAIGATIASLPAAAQPIYVNDQNYYYDGSNYYQACAQGADMNYCVVPDPNQ
jgi:hypothetical protein